MKIGEFLACFPFAATTRKTYGEILRRLPRDEDLVNLTAAGLVRFIQASGWGNSRQCVALAATQKYLRWAYGPDHPALAARIKRIRGKPQRALSPDLALELLASFNTYTRKGSRDLAICTLALDTGLRASELCRLQLADVDLDRCTLQVIVKGGQWAAAVFSSQTAENIRRWLHYRQIADGKGYLFTGRRGAGLTSEGLYKIVSGWGTRIRIRLSPHDLRRSFATLATGMGAPERVLMEGGRWSNSEMILRYTRTLKLETMRRYLPVAGLLGKGDEMA